MFGSPDSKQKLIMQAHQYRFDQALQRHVLDKICLYPSKRKFPEPYHPFAQPEPVKDTSSLISRNKWDRWQAAKEKHQQSDSAQYHLIYSKLVATDATLFAAFGQLEATISQIREMSEAVAAAFAKIPIKDLRTLVASIPSHIKRVAEQLQKTNGIIINNENLKLTPAFLDGLKRSGGNVNTFMAGGGSVQQQQKDAPVIGPASGSATATAKDGSLVSLAGIPFDSVQSMLKSMYTKKQLTNEEKSMRRFTLSF